MNTANAPFFLNVTENGPNSKVQSAQKLSPGNWGCFSIFLVMEKMCKILNPARNNSYLKCVWGGSMSNFRGKQSSPLNQLFF